MNHKNIKEMNVTCMGMSKCKGLKFEVMKEG